LYLIADPWDGAKTLTGAGPYDVGTQNVVVNTEADACYEFLYWTVDLGDSSWVTGDLGTEPLEVDMNGNVTLTAHFACPPCEGDLDISIIESTLAASANAFGISLSRVVSPSISICVPGCAIIDKVTVNGGCEDLFPLDLEPPYDPDVLNIIDHDDTGEIDIDYLTGEICFIGDSANLPKTYTIDVTYTNPCGAEAATGTVTIEFKDCSPTYNVYYNANTGTGTQTDTNDYFAGASVTVKDKNDMAKTNYTFTGWNTVAIGTGTAYAPAATFPMPASDVTLYAQWEKLPCVYLSFNNGTRCHDWLFVNIEDAKNLHKAEITLEQTNSTCVSPQSYSVGDLMTPYGIFTHTTSVNGITHVRTITITVTEDGIVEVAGDGNIAGVYFSACSSGATSQVTIVGSTLYDKGNNVINHTVGTSSLTLPGLGGWN